MASAQVYSNDVRKYYDLPGQNAYIMSGDVVIAGAVTNAPNTVPVDGGLALTTVGSIQNYPDLCNISPSAFSVNKEGMYSVKLIMDVLPNVNPTTTDIDCEIDISLTRTGDSYNGILMDRQLCRMPAPGAGTVGSTQRLINFTNVMYLKAGDQLNIIVKNYSDVALTLKQNSTQLIVNKIY